MDGLTLKDLISESKAHLEEHGGDPVVLVRVAGRLYPLSGAPEAIGEERDQVVFDAVDRQCGKAP